MNGILIINKPQNFTSQDVVSKVKKILKEKKAGHTGTLDPLATGILPVLLGDYTKLSKYLIEHNKTYIATIKLGEKTETGDSEGKIIEEKKVPNLEKEEIKENILTFFGKQKQIPPIYSAIKVNGKKLYKYAMAGEKVDIPEREIEIFDIKLLEFSKQNQEITFEVKCSKGTYIRVLCEDIAQKLNTVGYMKSLIRTSVDKFTLENAYTFEALEKGNFKLIKMEDFFSNLEKIELKDRKKELFLNGVRLTFNYPNGLYNIYHNGKYLGLGIVKEELLKRDIIIK